nr:hypothetical protein [Tanacetum cinerariifolium]
MIFDGMVKNVNNKISKFLMYPMFLMICLRMSRFGQITHTHQYVGDGSGTPTEPHHTPTPEADTSHHTTSSIPLPSLSTAHIPPITQTDTTPIRQYSKRTRIAQSSALPTVADEPASPVRDVSEGEACPTESGLIADQDRATIAKSFTLPHDSEPKEEEILRLKERVQVLEDRDNVAAKHSGDDATIKGRSINEGEAAAERISNNSEEVARVLTSMDAATVLARGIDVPTGSGSIPTAGPPATVISTGSEVEDFIPMGSKEEAKRLKRKVLNLEKEHVKKQKSSEEAPEMEKSTEEITKEKMKEMMQLVPVEDVYVQALQVKHPIIDWNVHTEGQRSYWKIISIRPAISEKEMELWVELKMLYEPDPKDQLWTLTQNFMHAPVEWKLYDLIGVHHLTTKDKEIFILVEKDYPLRKVLALVMISYKLQSIQRKHEEELAANAQYWKIPACCDDDDDHNFAITPNEPVDSLNMGDEHLDTISVTESDEFIKSSVENLVPNPKKIFSNPLFEEEIIPMKIDQHYFNAESDLIESLLNQDSLIIPSSSKIDSLLDEFAGELTLLKSIPSGIDKTDCYPKGEIRLTKRLLNDNSSPRPPEEFVSENSNADIESFSPYPIPVKDSDSFMEEIDLSFTLDDPMPPGIEDDDYDSERDILICEELLDNYSLSLPELKEPMEDQPLPADASPIALSPNYVVNYDPEKDEKYPKEDPADYPANRGDNDDDESSNGDDDDDD